MNVTIKQENETVTVKICGRLDTNTAPELDKKLEDFYGMKEIKLILDCSEMEYISSSGLRVFLGSHKKLTANDSSLIIINLQSVVKTVFDMTGFSKFLCIQ